MLLRGSIRAWRVGRMTDKEKGLSLLPFLRLAGVPGLPASFTIGETPCCPIPRSAVCLMSPTLHVTEETWWMRVPCTRGARAPPGFAPALMGKALSHIVVDDFDEAERLLKDEVLAAMPEDEDARRCLVCVTPWRDGKAKPKLCLPRWPPAKARERSWPPGCLKNSGKNRRLV